MTPLLTVSNISLTEHGQPVLVALSFVQAAGQKLALTGESGAGKSTLLQVIAGLVQPGAGEVRVTGQRVRGPAETLVPGHPGVAYLTQRSALPRSLRVGQVLRYASPPPAAEAEARVRRLADVCRIGPLLERRTDQLSGGEQQRVALARLLLSSPQLLLLDEPFASLDRTHKQVLQAVLEDISAQLAITCLLVSHDAADVLSWADEILVLQRGRLVQQGPPEQVYRQPVSEYVAGLFGDYSLLRGADRDALGKLPDPAASPPDGRRLLIRPEEFRLGPAGSGRLMGTVRSVQFFGSYCLVEVQLPESRVQVRADFPTPLAAGNVVHVSVVAGGGWELAA